MNYTHQIIGLYKQIDFDFSILKKKFSGSLQLGASTTIGQYLLPPVLAKFYQRFPRIKLSLLNDSTEKIEAALLDQRIELGMVEGLTKSRSGRETGDSFYGRIHQHHLSDRPGCREGDGHQK